MKRSISVITVLCLALLFTAVFSFPTQESDAAVKKAKFSYVKLDRTREYPDGTIYVWFKYPQLKGDSKAIKKINSTLKKEARKHVNSYQSKDLFDAGENREIIYGPYYNTVNGKVRFNKKGILSIRYTTQWYGGGVGAHDKYGDTFSLKTGKKLKITKVVKKKYSKTSKLRKVIYNKLKKKYNKETADIFKQKYKKAKKLRNIDFYINDKGKVIVCFPKYDIGYGYVGFMSVSLPSRY